MKINTLRKSCLLLVIFATLSVGYSQKTTKKATTKVGKKTEQNSTNGYTVTINTKNLANEKLKMYLQYGTSKKEIITDSISIKENNQKIVFRKKDKIVGAIYFLKFESQKDDVMLALDNDTNVELTIDSNIINSVVCTKNQLNIDFLNYQKQEKQLDKSKKIALRTEIAAKYPNSVLNLYFKIENKIQEEAPKTLAEKEPYRDSYFNFMDRNDKRIHLLPNIYRLLYSFVITMPIDNDNYKKDINIVLKDIPCTSNNYGVYCKWFISNIDFFQSAGIEESYQYLYNSFIKKNECKTFTDSEMAMENNKYLTIEKLPFNTIVPEIEMVDSANNSYQFSKLYSENDFTLLALYSPDCKHCQEMMPKVAAFLNSVATKYPNKKIKLVTLLNDITEDAKWQEFIESKNLKEFLNLKPANQNYKNDLTAYYNPYFLMVNKTGNILLKLYNPRAIEDFIKKPN